MYSHIACIAPYFSSFTDISSFYGSCLENLCFSYFRKVLRTHKIYNVIYFSTAVIQKPVVLYN